MRVKIYRHEEPSQGKEKGESIRNHTKPPSKVGIFDFAMRESFDPYDLVQNLCKQGLKITWSQIVHLAPKVRMQWAKMMSTR